MTQINVHVRRKGAVLGLAASALLALAGCADSAKSVEQQPDGDVMGHGHADVHAEHDMTQDAAAKVSDVSGTGSGAVRAIAPDGASLVVDHGPIDGIGMGAMTMSFVLAPAAARKDLAVGDSVEFDVRAVGNDFEITALCIPAKDGADCLSTN